MGVCSGSLVSARVYCLVYYDSGEKKQQPRWVFVAMETALQRPRAQHRARAHL